ncbi:hypothetical protein CERSUDRAFT_100768 [Gelatoporia subvermispora B]|uniref:Uncharacterized protein n=1 Tax=Ceriporiopsis subvermispora (strain B) TaxID=914234 RepID=M2QWZ6_CERS8|nr:hypothetical protein CERSUDRAFT_100768 [Gelatoporia subvermispora B]
MSWFPSAATSEDLASDLPQQQKSADMHTGYLGRRTSMVELDGAVAAPSSSLCVTLQPSGDYARSLNSH